MKSSHVFVEFVYSLPFAMTGRNRVQEVHDFRSSGRASARGRTAQSPSWHPLDFFFGQVF